MGLRRKEEASRGWEDGISCLGLKFYLQWSLVESKSNRSDKNRNEIMIKKKKTGRKKNKDRKYFGLS